MERDESRNEARFFNLRDPDGGTPRRLASGMTARVFTGERSMLSVVTVSPGCSGELHSHPEEQWGVLLEGSGVRIQDGREHSVRAGDFWHTPAGVEHGFRAGEEGALILDLFSPPRQPYREEGSGFAVPDP